MSHVDIVLPMAFDFTKTESQSAFTIDESFLLPPLSRAQGIPRLTWTKWRATRSCGILPQQMVRALAVTDLCESGNTPSHHTLRRMDTPTLEHPERIAILRCDCQFSVREKRRCIGARIVVFYKDTDGHRHGIYSVYGAPEK